MDFFIGLILVGIVAYIAWKIPGDGGNPPFD
jgi:hypothetical protein